MKVKSIARGVGKIFPNADIEYNTIFLGTTRVESYEWAELEKIFAKYKVKVLGFGIDVFGKVYIDLDEMY